MTRLTRLIRAILAAATASAAAPALAAPGQPAAAPAMSAVHGDPGCLPRASDGAGAEPSREALRAAGTKVVGEMMACIPLAKPTTGPTGERAAPEIGAISMDAAFANLWARCGLTRRERSFVTLGILMALRANSELEYHFRIARNNGLTKREIDEAIYQASGYAGFPAAANASAVYGDVLKADGAAGK